jgi:hypothetical protein
MAPGSLTIAAGEDKVREWQHPDGGFVKGFCEVCGSHLFGRDPAADEISIVRMAAIDGDPGVRPQAHQFVAYAPTWEPVADDGLPRFDEALPGR